MKREFHFHSNNPHMNNFLFTDDMDQSISSIGSNFSKIKPQIILKNSLQFRSPKGSIIPSNYNEKMDESSLPFGDYTHHSHMLLNRKILDQQKRENNEKTVCLQIVTELRERENVTLKCIRSFRLQ